MLNLPDFVPFVKRGLAPRDAELLDVVAVNARAAAAELVQELERAIQSQISDLNSGVDLPVKLAAIQAEFDKDMQALVQQVTGFRDAATALHEATKSTDAAAGDLKGQAKLMREQAKDLAAAVAALEGKLAKVGQRAGVAGAMAVRSAIGLA